MKRTELLKHLQKHGCVFLREGRRHSWWINTNKNKRSSIPRHNEISDQLARKICKDLGIPPIRWAIFLVDHPERFCRLIPLFIWVKLNVL